MNESAVTGVPSWNVQPWFILMFQVIWSLDVIDDAIAFCGAAVLGSYVTRPVKILSMTLPPPVSLVLAGTNGFCGSDPLMVTVPLPPPLLLEPPQPVSARANTAPPTSRALRVRIALSFVSSPLPTRPRLRQSIVIAAGVTVSNG